MAVEPGAPTTSSAFRSQTFAEWSVAPFPLIKPDLTISVIRLSDGFHDKACATWIFRKASHRENSKLTKHALSHTRRAPATRTVRVLLDTNCLVSALLQPNGNPSRILDAAKRKVFEIVVSEEILREVEDVIARRAHPRAVGRRATSSSGPKRSPPLPTLDDVFGGTRH